MVNWQLVCLATIAVTTVIMAAVQVVLLLETARLARQAAQAAEDIKRELEPLIAKAHRIADDAGRATALALVQVERVDRLMSTTTARLDEVVGAVHEAIVEPLKQGAIWLGLIKAAMSWFSRGRTSKPRREDEDAMFVG